MNRTTEMTRLRRDRKAQWLSASCIDPYHCKHGEAGEPDRIRGSLHGRRRDTRVPQSILGSKRLGLWWLMLEDGDGDGDEKAKALKGSNSLSHFRAIIGLVVVVVVVVVGVVVGVVVVVVVLT
jgi:hypothetical protein